MALDRVRILPVTMAAAALLFTVKVVDVWRGATEGLGVIGAAEARAEDKPAAAEAAPESPAMQAAPDPALSDERSAADTLASKDPSLFSKSEIELLENLARRRDEIEQRAREVEMRENLLQATENRIDQKINDLKQIEDRIQGMLRQFDKEEEAQIKSLVKVYENMKPKDAARIFNRLEMDILLDVVERMKEKKMAPVLAQMSPEKAEALTVELATRRQLPESDSQAAGAEDKN